jgi:hypothetical protein
VADFLLLESGDVALLEDASRVYLESTILVGFNVLLESGDALLLENGDNVLLEQLGTGVAIGTVQWALSALRRRTSVTATKRHNSLGRLHR